VTTRFAIVETPIHGLSMVERMPRGDKRGYLERLFCDEELRGVWGDAPVVQINRTVTRGPGAIRGMHFQRPPHAEQKLVSCTRGKVFDVAVDLRQDSETFLNWHGVVLSEDNHTSLLIPAGFAHGFQLLTDDCELLYLHSARYAPGSEGGLNPLDPRLSIDWPLPPGVLSDRDAQHPILESEFEGITL
jgi:dTDP-4-dehydrorhamnose 3,5-epimerase